MATRAKRACRVRRDVERKGASARGYDRKWRAARMRYLAENPTCRFCERDGKVIAATIVDHIVAHRGRQDLFWSRSNWQPLCKRHHDRKTREEYGE